MTEEDEHIYREEQRFGSWLRWVVFLSMILTIPLSIFSITLVPSEQGLSNMLVILIVIIAGIFVPIAIGFLFLLLKLETEVRSDGLYIRFFPIHVNFKRFAAEDLNEYYAREYNPLREYGGWGIRCSLKNGRAYNVSGNKGVQLVFKNGKQLLIGSQKSEQLEKAIRSIMEKNASDK